MKTIEIDDEVYSYLQSHAIPFEENLPNATIRRLFNLGNTKPSTENEEIQKHKSTSKRKKQPKTNLLALIKVGKLQEGQKLYLYNYQGEKMNGYEAIISGKLLLRNNKSYSMSELAKICLKENGYTSDFVQGPARWFNSDGKSVIKLWNDFLKKGE
jgi:negative regulator of replication initiation